MQPVCAVACSRVATRGWVAGRVAGGPGAEPGGRRFMWRAGAFMCLDGERSLWASAWWCMAVHVVEAAWRALLRAVAAAGRLAEA